MEATMNTALLADSIGKFLAGALAAGVVLLPVSAVLNFAGVSLDWVVRTRRFGLIWIGVALFGFGILWMGAELIGDVYKAFRTMPVD
jgi:hypothetical protein